MNSHKLRKYTEPGAVMFFVVMLAFAVAAFFLDRRLAYAEAGVIAALAIYTLIRNRKRQKELQAFVESVTYNAESATNNTLIHFPLPMAVFRLGDSGVVWGNQPFWSMCGRTGPALDAKLTGLVPEFSSKWLMEGKNRIVQQMLRRLYAFLLQYQPVQFSHLHSQHKGSHGHGKDIRDRE